MKKSAFYKDILRTLKDNLSRFIAITAMAALGTGVFSGFQTGCSDAFDSASNFLKKQNTYDIQIVSTLGLTAGDLSSIKKVDGITSLFGSRSLNVKVNDKRGSTILANLNTLSDSGINKPYVVKGRLPEKPGEIAVNSKFLEDSSLKLGASITLDNGSLEESSSAPSLAVKNYTIVAEILSPTNISNSKKGLASSSFSSSSSDYLMFVTGDSLKGSIYSTIYATVAGASEYSCYSSQYQSLIDNAVSKIKTQVQKERENARYTEILSDAASEIDKAEATLHNKQTDASDKLVKAQQKLDAGMAKLQDGKAALDANEAKLLAGQSKLTAAQKSVNDKMLAAQQQLTAGMEKLKAGEAELKNQQTAALDGFAENEKKLEENQTMLTQQKNAAKDQLSSAVEGLTAEAQKVWNSEAAQKAWLQMVSAGKGTAEYLLVSKQGGIPTKEQTESYNTAMQQVQKAAQSFAGVFGEAGVVPSQEQLKEFTSLAVRQSTLNYSQDQLDLGVQTLSAKKAATLEQLAAAGKKLESSKVQLRDNQSKLDVSRAKAAAEFASQQAVIDAGMKKLEAGKKEWSNAMKKLTEGQKQLDKNKADFEKSITSAQKKLASARNKLTDISKAKWYVWDRTDNNSIAGLKSDISFIQQITKAFPIMFFLVAVLISLTTMTRMVEEDRGLIGTYKSLGYSNVQISMKYLLYAIFACAFGGLLGSIVGFYGIPKVIGIITGSLYVLPRFELAINMTYGLLGFGLFVAGIVGATAISCKELLHHRPAELMRPKAPKAGNRILLERATFIWKRLSFLQKVTCRNLFRYKKRAVMTIFGILGCTMLIVLAFGVKDTVGGLMKDQFGRISIYDAIVITDHLSTYKMNKLQTEWKATGEVDKSMQLRITTLSLRKGGNNQDITVMVIPENAKLSDYIHLYDATTHKPMSLPKVGIVLTQNAARKLSIRNGSSVTLQNEEHAERQFPVAYVAENYAGNYVFMTQSSYQKAFGDDQSNAFLLKTTDSSSSEQWLKALKDEDGILNVSSSKQASTDFGEVNKLITLVVYILVAMSAVLALTVLFTLSNINISERERELATIKVLGFRHDEVYSYVNHETLVLTLIGILIGLPAGYLITYGILVNVTIADVAFKVRVLPLSYLIAAAITFVFALQVNRITNRSLRRINMVEALKSVE